MPLYHEGNRDLQDRFGSPRLADRLEQVTVYAPHADHTPPEPDWKRKDVFRDALPHRKPISEP